MKKGIFIGVLALATLTFTACNKNNGCPNSSVKAVVWDLDNDSCGVVFQLVEDNSFVEATNRSEFPGLAYDNGQLIWLKYKKTSGASTCGLGEIVRINCISEREF
jgi:hypothetical protein